MIDWEGTPFVRVYLTLGRDHPKVWRDLRLLGGYVRALTAAERSWPAPFEAPGLPADIVAALVADRVLTPDEDDGWYRFHGLDAERAGHQRRADFHSAGGRARIAQAQRDATGRLIPAGQPAGPAPAGPAPAGDAGYSNGGSSSLAGPAPAGVQQTSTTYTDTVDVDDDDLRSSSTSTPDQQHPAGAGQPPAPNGYVCRDPEAHDSPPRYIVGVGWRCPDCDAEDARADATTGDSFRAKVAKAGGWAPPARGGDDA